MSSLKKNNDYSLHGACVALVTATHRQPPRLPGLLDNEGGKSCGHGDTGGKKNRQLLFSVTQKIVFSGQT